jgi:hypothetical protein
MVIGNGLIGTEMKKIDIDDILFFCSGVSHSIEISQESFQREIDLLDRITSNFEYDKIIYFSSLSHLSNKIFLEHKGNVENKIKTLNKKYIIARLPTVVGKTGNSNNLIPLFVNSIKNSLPVNIHETFRSILDVSDLRRIVEYLLLDDYSGEININYIELTRIEDILFMLSKILKNTPKISKYVKGSDKFIINQNNDYVTYLLRELSIGGIGYTKKVLEKYYA